MHKHIGESMDFRLERCIVVAFSDHTEHGFKLVGV